MQTLSTIQALLPDSGVTAVDDATGLIQLVMSTPAMQATLCLNGAQLTHYQPLGNDAVLWCSPTAIYQAGKAVRGGVPICWPWFNAHPTDASLPSHGFARISVWTLLSVQRRDDDVIVRLRLDDSEASRRYWPFAFSLNVEFVLGRSLTCRFSVDNLDRCAVEFSYALHSYFSVRDIGSTQLEGLEGVDYLDQLDGMQRKRQAEPIRFEGETDRIYLDAPDHCRIIDAERYIDICSSGCRSIVVWNPWEEKARRLADMPDGAFRQMVCVESGNLAGNAVTLMPGAVHTAELRISVHPAA